MLFRSVSQSRYAWRVIREAWGMGYVDVQPVRSVAAVSYCLKYVTKSRIENMLDDSGLLSVVHKDNFLLVSKGFVVFQTFSHLCNKVQYFANWFLIISNSLFSSL